MTELESFSTAAGRERDGYDGEVSAQSGPKVRNSDIKILLPEGSSLSAREAVAALGPLGYVIDVCDPDPLCVARLSRYVRRFHRCPPLGRDPDAYLTRLLQVLDGNRYDVLLPVHEQAYLLARAAETLRLRTRLAVAAFESIERLQSKLAFHELLLELDLPQPPTVVVPGVEELAGWSAFPRFIKTAYGTAGSGTWRIANAADRDRLVAVLSGRAPEPLLVQTPAPGHLEVAQAVFDRGRLMAQHVYRQTIVGVGGSASGRVGVDRPVVRAHLERLGRCLNWHGPLMIDYLFDPETGRLAYIDPNPRMGETMNATYSGTNLAQSLVQVSLGQTVVEAPQPRAGVRSHILLATLLGVAERGGGRRTLARTVADALANRDVFASSREECALWGADPLSCLPLLVVLARLFGSPARARDIAAKAVEGYALSASAAERIRDPRFGQAG